MMPRQVMQQGIDLSGLRDIHLPPVPPLFPLPARFWIALTVLAAIVSAVWFVAKFARRLTARKYANREIDGLARRFSGNDYRLATEICLLMKRIAIMKHPEAVSLSGKKWRAFLEQTVKKPVFKGDAGDIVENVMYVPANRFKGENVAALVAAAKEWIAENT